MTTNGSSSSCVPFPHTPGNCTVVEQVFRWVGVLSLIGSIFVIILIYRLKKHKCLPQRLILALSVSSLILSVSSILSDDSVRYRSTQCVVQGFLLQFGVWTVLAWVTCISFNVCWNVLWLKITSPRQEFMYHVGSWGISALMACLPFFIGSDVYGPTGGWCWITSRYKLCRFVAFYIPLYTLLIAMVVAYIVISCKFSRRAKRWEGSYNPEQERINQQSKEAARSLLLYPVVYILLSIFPLINRVYQAVRGEGSAVLSLVVLHAISAPMMGFANAVVYAWDRETSTRVREALRNYRRRDGTRTAPVIMDYYFERTASQSLLSQFEQSNDHNNPYARMATKEDNEDNPHVRMATKEDNEDNPYVRMAINE